MPKFYVQINEFKLILDAPDKDSAIRKAICRLVENRKDFAFLITISEAGFNSPGNTLATSIIPFLKEMSYNLPSDDELINIACGLLNIGIDQMSSETANWLLGINEE